ncbi:MAG: hypothetical protein WCK35_01250 [Chloroflexota bacterium]
MAKTPSENGIFTKEFILEIVLKLLGFFFIVVTILVMLLIGLKIGEVTLSCRRVASRFSTLETGEKQPASPHNYIFFDDFSNPKSGWARSRDSDGMTDYENGTYRIQINTIGQNGNGMNYWANAGLESQLSADVQIEVDASKAGGSDDNDFGVMCRYTSTNDVDSYYQFLASSDGYAGIMLVTNGDQKVISADKLQPSDAVRKGKATNHIRADCIGDTLTLYINNKLVASAKDTSLIGGDVGLIASTYSSPGTDILFDNFAVRAP